MYLSLSSSRPESTAQLRSSKLPPLATLESDVGVFALPSKSFDLAKARIGDRELHAVPVRTIDLRYFGSGYPAEGRPVAETPGRANYFAAVSTPGKHSKLEFEISLSPQEREKAEREIKRFQTWTSGSNATFSIGLALEALDNAIKDTNGLFKAAYVFNLYNYITSIKSEASKSPLEFDRKNSDKLLALADAISLSRNALINNDLVALKKNFILSLTLSEVIQGK